MALLFDRNQVLLAKVETTRGTDASPAGADAVKCGVVNPVVDGQNLDRIAVSSTIAALKRLYVNKKISFSIAVEMKGSGAAGTAPEIGPLLQACGLTETVTGGVDVAYTPENTDADMKSCTIYCYKDGLVYKALGCMGNFRWDHNSGQYSTLVFDMQGVFSDVDDAANPTPTYDSTDPVQIQSAGLSFGSWNDAVCRGFTMNTGNTVGERLDINSSDGLKGMFISARDPMWTANIEAVLEATNTFWQDFIDRDTVALDITHGTVAGNILTYAAPAASYNPPAASSDQSLNMYGLSGQLLESSGEDNFTLTFT